MKKYLVNGYNDIFKAVLLMYLVTATDVLNNILNFNLPLIRYFFATAGIFYLLKGIYSTNRDLKFSSNIVKYSFYALLLVTIVMIVRGVPVILEGSNHNIQFKLFISGQLFLYLIPFIIFSSPNEFLLKKLLRLSYLLSIIYLFITIPLFWYFLKSTSYYSESLGVVFAAAASILLLTIPYHSVRVRWVSIITFLIAIFINTLFARRNQVLYFSTIILFFVLINLLSKSYFVKRRKSNLIAGLLVILFFVSGYIYVATNQFTYLFEKSQTGMESWQYVIEKFFLDFDAHPDDYIYGRGINGLVFAGGSGSDNLTGERAGIENGYLQHILVGGWIYLGLILLISLRAMYLGFFRSRNILSKAFAAIVATYLVDMIGFGIPSLTLKHFMIWMGVSVCYSAKMRNYTDEYLKSVVGIK